MNVVLSFFTRADNFDDLEHKINNCNLIIHLAGVNRPLNELDYNNGNVKLTEFICDILIKNNITVPVIYTSSIQAEFDNPYGKSKKKSEIVLRKLAENNKNNVINYRLPNVFGKWCKPNYNSAVATFCYNLHNGIPIVIHDKDALVNLVSVSDVVEEFVDIIYKVKENALSNSGFEDITIANVTSITVGDIVDLLNEFRSSTFSAEDLSPFERKLFTTYLSYAEVEL